MADITLPSGRPTLATIIVRAIDGALDHVEAFVQSMAERPEDLRRPLHEAQIHRAASAGCRGQAPL